MACNVQRSLQAIATGWPTSLEELSLKYFTGTHDQMREYPLSPDLDAGQIAVPCFSPLFSIIIFCETIVNSTPGLTVLFDRCTRLHSLHLHVDRLPLPKLMQRLNVSQVRAVFAYTTRVRVSFIPSSKNKFHELQMEESTTQVLDLRV